MAENVVAHARCNVVRIGESDRRSSSTSMSKNTIGGPHKKSDSFEGILGWLERI
jgi:hypothetical protein